MTRIWSCLIAAFLALLFAGLPGILYAERTAIGNENIEVLFEGQGRNAAEGMIAEFPKIMAELGQTLGLGTNIGKVTVILVREKDFRRMTRSHRTVALASAGNNTIAIDLLRAKRDLRGTLKHELAHLVLGHHINRGNLPRWLNEGVSQWASEGVSELLMVGKSTTLGRAVLLGRLIPLRNLRRGFPDDDKDLQLAYEQSLSIVEYIVKEHGTKGLRNMLGRLSDGETVAGAVRKSLSIDMGELLNGWRADLRMRHTLLSYLSNNIYTVLFVFAAILLTAAFLRALIKIYTYKDEDGEMPLH
jgi:hypothetical protein